MPSDSGDSRKLMKPHNQNSNNKSKSADGTQQQQPSDQDSLPCPRCDSTNTKFCYYNNYNLSQPRHFCKACRRYWTQGGTLRNIPVGGGTRKTAKRSRTSSPTTSSSAVSSPKQVTPVGTNNPNTNVGSPPPSARNVHNHNAADVSVSSGPTSVKSDMSLPICYDFNLNNNLTGSFSSMLQTQGGGGGGGSGPPPAGNAGGFLALGGFGLGLGSGFEDMGFELGRGLWAPLDEIGHGGSDATWHSGNGGDHGGYVDGDQFFGWPDLAISTTGKGLK